MDGEHPAPRPALVRRLVGSLASPRTAVALIAALAAYSFAVSSLTVAWAFSDPVFATLVALLTASTAVCSVRRTRRAVHAVRVRGRGAFALLGSAVFHWSLVALFVIAWAGHLTRSVGFVDLAVGESKADTVASYVSAPVTGPLRRQSALPVRLRLDKLSPAYTVGGVDHGPTPLVELSGGPSGRARAWVFPNHPLTMGALTVHRAGTGLASVLRVARPGAGRSEPRVLYHLQDGRTAAPVRFTLPAENGATRLVLDARPAGGHRLALTVVAPASFAGRSWDLAEGDVARVPDGTLLRVAALTRFARLGVVHDWSIRWIYALFAIGTAALAVAVFARPATIRTDHAEKGDGW